MPTKDRLLVLIQTLQERSDDETWLTTADLRAALEAEGHECSISFVCPALSMLDPRKVSIRNAAAFKFDACKRAGCEAELEKLMH